FINMILNNGSQILPQDRLAAFASIYNAGNFGLQSVFNYVSQNFSRLSSSFTASQISSLFNGIASRFTTIGQYSEIYALANNLQLSNTTLRSALLTAQANAAWSNQFISSITNWLQENSTAIVSTTTTTIGSTENHYTRSDDVTKPSAANIRGGYNDNGR
ncbi:hypothetical protein Trydic_g17312, partial [Trypoxylus dichotomus]